MAEPEQTQQTEQTDEADPADPRRRSGPEPTGAVTGPGRVAVVTGAASGIGRALAEALVARGGAIVVADLDGDGARAVAAALVDHGGDAVAVTVDVADVASVEALAVAATDRYGRVDLLVNNAGVSTFNLIQDQTLDDWRWVVGVNLWGVVHGVHAFLPILRDQGTPAHIVNTASMGGLMGGLPFIGPYGATKAAVVTISEALRQECAFAAPHIGVSVLCPGVTDTAVMESERGRPPSLGVEHRSDDAEAMRLAIRSMFTGPEGKTPAEVATVTLEAVDAGRFWVFSHPGERPIVEARGAEILAAFPPAG